DDRERNLDPRIVQAWRVLIVVVMAVPLGVGTVLALVLFGRPGSLVPLGSVGLLALLVGWYPRARYERWRWQLTPLALELRHGLVVQQHEAVPYFRIQQIDITRDPLDRLLDLASLQVNTASASGSAVIPGIAAAEAPIVRAELLARAAVAVAVAVSEHEGEISDAV
ncbi:MAG: PH domain-containing protein, partial [Actinomycetota bacterium]|nr:PH domain-containing protein [Actinomycetota bacterium]